jgi:hypothetical protein
MGNSKIVFGDRTLIDLSGDTVTPQDLRVGVTAHNAAGEQIAGQLDPVQLSLIVSVTSGSVVTATKGATVISGTAVNNSCTLIVPEAGTWSVSAILDGKASNTVSVPVTDSYAVALSFWSATITVTVDSGASVTLKNGSTTIDTKTSNGTVVFTVTQTGTYTVEAVQNDRITSGTVNVVSDTTAYALKLFFLKDFFEHNDWATIIAACHSGSVPDTWVVGNSKTMTIGGGSYQIDIIGKNHDDYADGSGKAPLTFQMHDCYGETKQMNSSNTNSGGWTSCAMRQTHLPAILSQMPTEVQSGIREVNKLTSAGNQSATINTTADKLFLLSEIEIFGSVSYSKNGEGTQYDYYKAGNSKMKKYNGKGSNWWERSPYGAASTYFCIVLSNGGVTYNYANYADGVAFGFCF